LFPDAGLTKEQTFELQIGLNEAQKKFEQDSAKSKVRCNSIL